MSDDLDLDMDAMAAGLGEVELPDTAGADDTAAEPETDDTDDAPDYKSALLESMQEAAEASDEPAGAADDGEPMPAWLDEQLRPYQAELAQHGLSGKDAVARLFAAEAQLRQDPQTALAFLARAYGRGDLAAIIQGGQGVQPGADQGQVAELQRHQRAQGQVAAFASARDESGQPKYPHFNVVAAPMGALMAIEPLTMEEAYQRATWAHPELRQQLTKSQQDAAAKAASEAQREAIRRAKQARTPRSGSVPVPAVADDDEDLPQAELLKKVMRQHASGARR